MLHPHDRWIQFNSLSIQSKPEHAPVITLDSIIGVLERAVQDESAIYMMDNGDASIRIAEIRVAPDRSHIQLLFQYANKIATDPVFMHFERHLLRTVHKLEGEGVAVSGHAVIGCHAAADGTYPFLVEEVPGIGRTNVQKFLRKLFKTITEGMFIFRDEAENGREKTYRPFAEVLGDPSASFEEDLRGGTMDRIELVKFTQIGHGEFDEPGHFVEEQHVVKVRVLEGRLLGAPLANLRSRARRAGFAEMKIRYTKSEGKRRTAIMGTDSEDLESAAVVRTEMVQSANPLPQCSEHIETSFADHIASYL